MTLADLQREAEQVRKAFRATVANGTDGKALAQRWDAIQTEINERIASGQRY